MKAKCEGCEREMIHIGWGSGGKEMIYLCPNCAKQRRRPYLGREPDCEPEPEPEPNGGAA